MISKRQRNVLLALALVVSLILTACGTPTVETVKETVIVEGTSVEREVTRVVEVEKEVEKVITATPEPEEKILIVGMDIHSTSIDPANHFEVPSAVANFATYQQLVQITADNWHEPAPMLAERWEVSDDGLTYTFHLNPDARFHSGNPVTAEDVRFSLMRLKNLQGPPAYFVGQVDTIEVVDDLTVKITLTAPTTAFLQMLGVAYASIYESAVVKENGGTDSEDAPTTDSATAFLDQNSPGSGPYILTRWTPRYEIVLEKNPNYWGPGPEPKLDKIILRQVDDPTTAFQMLQRGDMDILLNADKDLLDQAEANPDLNTLLLDTLDIRWMSMTCDPELSEPLSDQRVRQAIAYALDRDGLMEAVESGSGKKQPSILPIGMPGVDPAMTKERDLDKARELLAEAGYGDGFDLELTYPTAINIPQMATKVQADLAEVGIRVELIPMDFSTLISTWYDSQEPAMYISIWIPDYVDLTAWTDYWGYSDHDFMWIARCDFPEIGALSADIGTKRDLETRAALATEWQEKMMDAAFAIPLYQFTELVIMRKEVSGFGYIPVKYTDFGLVDKE